MKKIVLSLFILFMPVCLWAGGVLFMAGGVDGGATPTFYHDVPCTDNAASTVVTNNGTSSFAWTSSANTSTISDSGTRFLLNDNNEYIRTNASDNWTAEKLTIVFTTWFQNDPAVSNDTTLRLDVGVDATMGFNEFWLYRSGGSSQWTFVAWGASGAAARNIITTDHSASIDTKYTYTLTIDASGAPWTVTLKQDETTLTFGAWSTDDTVAAVFNAPITFSENGGAEADAYFNDIKTKSDE